MHLEYPKWLKVDGPGHPQNPGNVLVENEDQEREVLAGGDAPRDLNPANVEKPEHEGEKPIEEMGRDDLISALVRESITDDVTDDQLRASIANLRDRSKGDTEPLKDAAGDKVPPPVDQEANKGKDDGIEGRTLPEAKSAPATDGRPDDAKAKEPDSKQAGNITEVAKTPPGASKGSK